MTFTFYIKLFLSTLGVFLVIDLFWLGLVARGFYRERLGFLMRSKTNWAAAVLFYLIFVVGLLIFAVVPGLQAGLLSRALLKGVLYGLFTYATYDLTNLATLKNWPLGLTAVDILWGMFLAGSVSTIAFLIGGWL
ncbi:MAG: DUF2177 family protein [Anaerolineales bacterium]